MPALKKENDQRINNLQILNAVGQQIKAKQAILDQLQTEDLKKAELADLIYKLLKGQAEKTATLTSSKPKNSETVSKATEKNTLETLNLFDLFENEEFVQLFAQVLSETITEQTRQSVANGELDQPAADNILQAVRPENLAPVLRSVARAPQSAYRAAANNRLDDQINQVAQLATAKIPSLEKPMADILKAVTIGLNSKQVFEALKAYSLVAQNNGDGKHSTDVEQQPAPSF